MPVQNKFSYTWQSKRYDAISGAKATNNLKEPEDETGASTVKTSKLSMKPHKDLHV